ncbi:MAG: serine hydrolase [Candidatus Paceibacterota bacterium]
MSSFIENTQRSEAIARIVKTKGFDKKVSELSIAVIDLKNPSEIFGANLDAFMYPASVFKIFIGAEVLRQVEEGKHTLAQEILVKLLNEIPKELRLYPDPRTTLKTGDKVAIDKLLYLMLAVSDNTASNCLYELVGMESIIKNIVEPNGWQGTGLTPYFIDQVKQHKPYRHTEMLQTNARHVAEFFALVEQEKLISPFVSRKLKEYMLKFDRTSRHGYSYPEFLRYRKGGYLETNLYTSFYRKSGFGFDMVKGFGALVKNIVTKGWAFQRYMHDAGVIEGKNSKYVAVIFTLSRQMNPRKFFQMNGLAKELFEYMEAQS